MKRLVARPPPMSIPPSAAVSLALMKHWYHAFVGSICKLWRLNRRRLRPGVRDAFAQLLMEIRIDYLPDKHLDSVSNIGRSRHDIRRVTELMGYIADRTHVSAAALSGDSSGVRSSLNPDSTDQGQIKTLTRSKGWPPPMRAKY